MNRRLKAKFKIITACLLVFFIVFGVLIIWLYSGNLTSTKTKIFTILPLPIASVGGQFISINDYFFRKKIAQQMLGKEVFAQNEEKTKNLFFDAIIKEAQTNRVAQKNSISVSPKQINAEFTARSQQNNIEDNINFSQLLSSYGLTESDYKDKIIKQELLSLNIQVWQSSQKSLNTALYAQTENLASRIKNGEDMSVLATTFSQDETGKQTFGDSGFVDVSQVLPELREPLESIATGELKIIPSRYGLHIVRLEDRRGNLMHLRQIFLQNTSFSSWFKKETGNLKVYKFINI